MKNFCTCLVYLFIFTFLSSCQIAKSNQTNKFPTPEKISISPEQKAIKLAEEFIARNGYTKKPADRESITYESIEFTNNVDELLEDRNDTLEPKAYGYLNKGKDGKGWTVVFEFSVSSRQQNKKDGITDFQGLGRAVTMNHKFEHLRVEHKVFILKFAKKIDSGKQDKK